LGSLAREREDLIGAEINVAGASDPRDLSGSLTAVEDQAGAADVEFKRTSVPGLIPSARRTSSGIVTWPFWVTLMPVILASITVVTLG